MSGHIFRSWTIIMRNIIQMKHNSSEFDNGPGKDHGYVCSVTLTLKIWSII